MSVLLRLSVDSAFNPFGVGLAFAFTFGVFAHYYLVVAERDKNKRVAMRYFSREIMIYCHSHLESCFFIGLWFY